MNAPETILPPDRLAPLVDADTQRQAARLAQEAFARVFRLSVAETEGIRHKGVQELHSDLSQWCAAADDGEAHALRLALLLTGLDQWGLAWSQAFGLVAIPGLSELVGALRTSLDEAVEARFLRHFEAIAAAEENAIDFKVELRRGLHLALWHSSIVTESRNEALRLAAQLGSQLLAHGTVHQQEGQLGLAGGRLAQRLQPSADAGLQQRAVLVVMVDAGHAARLLHPVVVEAVHDDRVETVALGGNRRDVGAALVAKRGDARGIELRRQSDLGAARGQRD